MTYQEEAPEQPQSPFILMGVWWFCLGSVWIVGVFCLEVECLMVVVMMMCKRTGRERSKRQRMIKYTGTAP